MVNYNKETDVNKHGLPEDPQGRLSDLLSRLVAVILVPFVVGPRVPNVQQIEEYHVESKPFVLYENHYESLHGDENGLKYSPNAEEFDRPVNRQAVPAAFLWCVFGLIRTQR